jgi:cytochrome c oxidase subunit 2
MYSAVLSAAPTRATFDFLFNWYLISGIIAGGFVIGLLLFFAVRYRARKGAPPPSKGPESLWVVLAVVVIMALALGAAGYQTFAAASNIEIPNSPGSVTVKVTAFQWGWNFTYPNGRSQLNNLTVPADRVVILNITSRDVYHALGIPMLAVKEDAIPGKVNQLWFEVPSPGFYKDAIHCFELCGVGHAFMMANLTVISQPSWDSWMAQ